MRLFLIFLALLMTVRLSAQKVLTEAELLAIVGKYHPVARQAGLDVRIARAQITQAQGAFDPTFRYDNSQKYFGGTQYYDYRWTEIKIPTWYGVDIYAGRESASGTYRNPEETPGSVEYLGVSLPLVQNLVIDKRRAALLQARLFGQQSEVERLVVINDLLQATLTVYWEWWNFYQQQVLVDEVLRNAISRFEFVKTAYRLGDRPAIDTLEALTQVQTFQQRSAEITMELVQRRIELGAFLWTAEGESYDLPADVVPQQQSVLPELQLDILLGLGATHPELRLYDFKLRSLQIDRRVKFQALLPDVDLKYNQLGRNFSTAVKNPWFNNNYRFGISVAVPLRLSEGRGALREANLKIEQTRLAQDNKRVQLNAKIRQYFTEWQQTRTQLNLQQELVQNFSGLQRGEEIRFNNGESSLFLINSRELKTIESRQKLIDLQAKVQKARVGLQWAAGIYGRE